MTIDKEKISELNQETGKHNAKWIAVTKYQSRSTIIDLYNMGLRLFGENRAQEFLDKYEDLPHDIEWHFIGHLQTNKVKHIIDKVKYIHSVDSLNLLNTIQKEAAKLKQTMSVFIQVKIAKEDTKYGMSKQEALSFFYNHIPSNFPNVNIVGLMGMASLTKNTDEIDREFKSLDDLKNQIVKQTNWKINELSMGMSNDYKLALKHHATYIRIGSVLFD